MTDLTIPVPEDPSRRLAPGEAYTQCMRAIRHGRPDYESAQIYALLSMNETLENVAARLAELNASIRRPEQ